MSTFSQPVLYYVHVPKTAGTTMRIILLWMYWWNQILWARGKPYLEQKAQSLSNADLSRIRLVAGHTRFGMHEHLPFSHFQYFTILREPVDRVLSHYYFLCRQPQNELYETIHQYDLSLVTLLTEGYIPIHNVQTYWLSKADVSHFRDGAYHPDIVREVKENIDQYFSFVGLNEWFDESLIMLKRDMGWKRYPIYAQKNVTKSRRKQDKESAETIDTIKRYNQMDVEIYDHVAQLFHTRLQAIQNDNFDREVAYLQALNQRYGRLKPYRLKLLSGLISQSVQRLFSAYDKPEVLP